MSDKSVHEDLRRKVADLEREVFDLKETLEISLQSERKYRNLFEYAFNAIFVLDAEHKYIDVNRKASEILGYSREELLTMSPFDLIHPEQIPRSETEFAALKDRGVYENFVSRIKRKDGKYIDIEVSSCALFDDGKVVGSVDIAQDITQRLKAEKEIRNLKQQIEYILGATKTGLNIIDIDYNVRYVDPEWKRVYSDFHGVKCYDYLMGCKAKCPECRIDLALQTGGAVITEYRLPKENNRVVQVTTIPFQSESDEMLIAGIYVDITERKEVEKELFLYRDNLEKLVEIRTAELLSTNEMLKAKVRERNLAEQARQQSDDRYKRLIDNLKKDYFIYSHDPAGVFNYVSSSIEDVLGYTPKEFYLHYSKHLTPNPINKRMSEYTDLCLQGKPQSACEIEVYHKDGSERWLEISEAPIFGLEGSVMAVEGIAHDITGRKKIEKELVKAQKLESTGILAGGIAHDFNNLLTAILGNISLAKMHSDPQSKVFTKLSDIEKASWRARDLTQQLLTFSKGGSPVTKAESMKEMIRESAWFTLRGSNVKCEFCGVDELWAVEVDEGQICQVIQNIATNADQAMPGGGILQISGENLIITEDDALPLAAGKYVLVSFKDTGKGIPADYLDKIFDPYFTTKQKGSGLGLAICYSIVKNHQGLIVVESEKDKGTTFHVYLKATDKYKASPDAGLEELVQGEGRILLMDDEEVIRDIGCEMLDHLGYEVKVASDGSEAVSLYRESLKAGNPYDVVIMDLTIPGGMGGQEAMAEIIKIDPQAKGIVSSGYANDQVMSNFKDFGFKAIIPKPYKIELLSRILSGLIRSDIH